MGEIAYTQVIESKSFNKTGYCNVLLGLVLVMFRFSLNKEKALARLIRFLKSLPKVFLGSGSKKLSSIHLSKISHLSDKDQWHRSCLWMTWKEGLLCEWAEICSFHPESSKFQQFPWKSGFRQKLEAAFKKVWKLVITCCWWTMPKVLAGSCCWMSFWFFKDFWLSAIHYGSFEFTK